VTTTPAAPASHPTVAAPTRLDGLVERLARRAAGRTTRRSFLGRAGRAAVLVAAGPTLATVLSRDVAEARVCGQSGVSPLCATFDCDATWGWCWYASGCCADGLLKKICDCCAPNTPNPVGYCPSGTRVLCVVESCGQDPRLQVKRIEPLPSRDPVGLSVALSGQAYPDGAPIAVLGDAGSGPRAALAASLGSVLAGPVLLTDVDVLDPSVAEELRRLGTEFVTLVGPTLSRAVVDELRDAGMFVERVGAAEDLAALSVEVAVHSRRLTGSRRAMVVTPAVPAAALGSVAAVALLHRLPLLFGAPDDVADGLAEPRPVRETYLVGGTAAELASVPGGTEVRGSTPAALADALATLLLALGGAPDVIVLAEDDAIDAAVLGLAGAPVLLHEPSSLEGSADWLFAHRDRIAVARPAGALQDDVRYDLQSVLNEFEAHLLRGDAGEGLPVIPQPRSERPIGRARV